MLLLAVAAGMLSTAAAEQTTCQDEGHHDVAAAPTKWQRLLQRLKQRIKKRGRKTQSDDSSSSWEDSLDYGDLWDYFDCDEVFETERPIHNQSTWMLLRGAYQGVVGPDRSSIAPLSHENGFQVSFEVQQFHDKGRGLVATQKVKKGDLVWTARRQTARFGDGPSYRRFLASIPTDLACDVIQWAYVQAFGVPLICVDLDECSFMNNGSYEANIGCIPEAAELLPGGCKENYFALRDIEVGEELLCSYGEFAISDGWEWFGL